MKKRTPLLLLGLLLFLCHDVSSDEWYRWVDPEGRAILSRHPPPDAARRQQHITPPPKETPLTEVRRSGPSEASQVELYVTSWCPQCQKARAYLQQRGIPFKQYDVEKDQDAARRMKMINPRGAVPLAVINGQKILGFSPRTYQTALGEMP